MFMGGDVIASASVIASEAKQSTSGFAFLGCFAALAVTNGLLRPLASQ
jgi:hypothetical protein